jgi:hypothetical protein
MRCVLVVNVHDRWIVGSAWREVQGYDLHNDQALSNLQTTINKESAH